MEKIAIYGKGGIGKSMVATSLSIFYAQQGQRVLHVGCDPKSDSAVRLLEQRGNVRTVLDVLGNNPRAEATTEILNDGRYDNPRYDQLIRQANSMAAGPERNKVFAQAETILIEQDHGIMPIYYYVSQNFIDTNKWGGWYSNLMNTHPYWSIYKK